MLDKVVRFNAFRPSTDPVELAASHVSLRQLTGLDVEPRLFEALIGETPCAAEIVGPSGSGKSSCIMKVLGDVARMSSTDHEMLILTAGAVEDALTSTAGFLHHLVAVIREQEFRFADPVQERLMVAGADETTFVDAAASHTSVVEGGLPVLKGRYQYTLQQRHKSQKFGDNPARSRQELIDITGLMRANGARPVVVIDDTDKFAPGPGVDQTAIEGLFGNAVEALAELRIDFVVAVHPRFQGTDAYQRVKRKHVTTSVTVPYLPIETRPLLTILDRHLAAKGLAVSAADIIDDEAVTTLQGIYVGDRDLRHVLEITHRAALEAHNAGDDRVELSHLSTVVERIAR